MKPCYTKVYTAHLAIVDGLPSSIPVADITLSSTLTRTKPNCFVNLHQIERKALLHNGDINVHMAHFLEGMAGFNLTPAEEAATKNLLLFMCPSCTLDSNIDVTASLFADITVLKSTLQC